MKWILLGLFVFGCIACGPDLSNFYDFQNKPGQIIVRIDKSKLTEMNSYSETEFLHSIFQNNINEKSIHIKYIDKLWKKNKNKDKSIIAKLSLSSVSDGKLILNKLKKLPFVLSAEPNYYNRFFDKIDRKKQKLSSNIFLTLSNDNNNNNNNNQGEVRNLDNLEDYVPIEKEYSLYQKFIYDLIGIPKAWAYIFSRWPKESEENTKIEDPIHTAYVGVAVVDSGLALEHSEMDNKVFTNWFEEKGKLGVDDDGNGYIDDIYGINVNSTDNFQEPKDFNTCEGEIEAFSGLAKIDCYMTVGHGTHIAGIIGAKIDDSDSGIAGVCPNCYVLPIKATDRSGSIPDDNLIKALNYISSINSKASPHQVQIVNLSAGKMINSLAVEDAIRRISNNVLVIAAASNDDTEQPSYPAALPEVLSVGAIGGPDYSESMMALSDGSDKAKKYYHQKAIFSNFGNHIDLVAPGMEIYSLAAFDFSPSDGIYYDCGYGNRYCFKSGTSSAAPFVSAIAGMVWAYFFKTFEENSKRSDTITNPEWVKQILITSADGRIYESGYNNMYNGERHNLRGKLKVVSRKQMLGAGLVNAQRALNYQRIKTGELKDYHYSLASEDLKYPTSGCPIIVYVDKNNNGTPPNSSSQIFFIIFLIFISLLILKLNSKIQNFF